MENCMFCLSDLLQIRLNQSIGTALALVNHVQLLRFCIAEQIKIVSQKLHLHACILRIHRLHVKLLAA